MKTLIFSILFLFAQTPHLEFNDVSPYRNNEKVEATSKYGVGDIVKSSGFENESYWEGEVIRVVKNVLYQVEIKRVRVNGSISLYLNASDCTGKKRLSYEDGADYNETRIWVHERCLD